MRPRVQPLERHWDQPVRHPQRWLVRRLLDTASVPPLIAASTHSRCPQSAPIIRRSLLFPLQNSPLFNNRKEPTQPILKQQNCPLFVCSVLWIPNKPLTNLAARWTDLFKLAGDMQTMMKVKSRFFKKSNNMCTGNKHAFVPCKQITDVL